MTEDMTIMEGGDYASCVYVSDLDWDILSSSTVFSREKKLKISEHILFTITAKGCYRN